MDSFERGSLRFGVSDSGPPGGPTAVLLHGFPQQPAGMMGVAERLNADGIRTLVPTQRGYAAECRPPSRRDYRTDETVADVLALIDAAHLDKAHVVGHDWGGFQAWAVAAWFPERVASVTVLSTPHPAALARSLLISTQALRSWYMALFQLPELPEQMAARTLGRTLRNSGLPAELVASYVAAMREPGALTGALNWYRGIPFSRRRVGRVFVPTTYVWGRHDFALGRTAAELTERYVDAPYHFAVLDEGHWLPEAAPDAVVELVREQVRGSG